MITLTVVVYTIISLYLADHTYYKPWINFDPRNENKAYLNRRKSLIYGFLFIPKWIFIIIVAIALMILAVKTLVISVNWIITNMP